MDKTVEFLEKYASGPMARLSEQRHLRAIRDGVVASLPFILFGSLFLIVAIPPVGKETAWAVWAANNVGELLIPYRLTMYIMSLYVAFGVGYSLSRSYKLDPLSGGLLATAAFLFTIGIETVEGIGFVLPMTYLGGQGLFVGMLVSIFAVEVLRLCKEKNIMIKMPSSVPGSVARSFEALIPTILTLSVIALITITFKVDLHALMGKIIGPLVSSGGTLPAVLLIVFLITFLWGFGIHGVSVVGSIIRPIWLVYLEENATVWADTGVADKMHHIAPEPFYQWFIWIGGSGATLGLVIAMLFVAKSNYLKALGKSVLPASIFNINEPVIFGTPIVLNPILMIPFIIVPLVLTTISYIATSIGLVNKMSVLATWTLPAPFGAYLAANGDWRAIVLVLINIVIATLMYLPFVKIYDRKLLLDEDGSENEKATN